VLRIFIALQNPSPCPDFEPAIFGSSGQHINLYTSKETTTSDHSSINFYNTSSTTEAYVLNSYVISNNVTSVIANNRKTTIYFIRYLFVNNRILRQKELIRIATFNNARCWSVWCDDGVNVIVFHCDASRTDLSAEIRYGDNYNCYRLVHFRVPLFYMCVPDIVSFHLLTHEIFMGV
jgi:hypothetical protein